MMNNYKAVIEAMEGQEGVVASILDGLGFDIDRVGAKTIAEGSAELWADRLGIRVGNGGAVEVPTELAEVVAGIFLLSS